MKISEINGLNFKSQRVELLDHRKTPIILSNFNEDVFEKVDNKNELKEKLRQKEEDREFRSFVLLGFAICALSTFLGYMHKE